MDAFAKAITIAASVIGLLILLGGAWLLVRGAFNQARVKELREDNDDLRKRADDKDVEIDAMKLREDALETQLAQAQNEIELLTAMLTQRAEVSEVLQELKAHHAEARQFWANQSVAMTGLLNRLEQNDA